MKTTFAVVTTFLYRFVVYKYNSLTVSLPFQVLVPHMELSSISSLKKKTQTVSYEAFKDLLCVRRIYTEDLQLQAKKTYEGPVVHNTKAQAEECSRSLTTLRQAQTASSCLICIHVTLYFAYIGCKDKEYMQKKKKT